MTAIDLMLPEHLYRQHKNGNGEDGGVTYLHERLINWFDRGRGVDKLCDSIYESELADIAGREEDRLLMLEEQWLTVENGEDDEAFEAQYHQDCDAVTREAAEQRAIAKAQRNSRHAAINQLVSECAEHVDTHTPAARASHAPEFLIAFVIIGVLAYVML